ncbi:hypothetical protein EI42_04638 [Thermosporothrix hazakensis]|uniref:Uncharacterized protein n=1 Tax=Thermosporothrix hazakensis TaxID=644383 RepID=A0A326U4N6_THEHA|nr:hypothetical protein [Thermosporothrix hazakensis]PZW24192.1 hypothetical protein EI42_04638 [Thermosporothrix hazakensis]GCE47824.1 hypothetical protein KTH_26930 [Thermosporothrix hazakensis]
MEPHDEFFSPECIDEQIDELLAQGVEQRDGRLVQHLRQHYEAAQRQQVLDRAWKRVQLAQEQRLAMEPVHLKRRHEKITPPAHSLRTLWFRLALVAVIVLMLGSLTLVLGMMTRNNGSASPVTPIVTPTPTAIPPTSALPTPTIQATPQRPIPTPTINSTPTVPTPLPTINLTPQIPPLP